MNDRIHRWLFDDDRLGGIWIDSNGLTYCAWAWSNSTQTLIVTTDGVSHAAHYPMDQSLVDVGTLRRTLPEVGAQIAERIRKGQMEIRPPAALRGVLVV